MKNSIVKDFVMPIAVLTAICLVISGALALTNSATAPVITDGNAQRTAQACQEALPAADGFEELKLEDHPTIKEIYKATNGVGYVFTAEAKGYGGKLTILCSLDAEGKIVNTKVLKHSETPGMGSKAATEEYGSRYQGADSLDSVNTLISTGVTITSNAYAAAIQDIFAAYNAIK